jgi:hypothetical protein
MLEAARALIRETESFGVVCTFTENSALRAKVPAKSVTDQLSKREKRKRDELTGDPSGCTGCGRTNHQVEDCKFNKSQFFNKTSTPYKSSEAFTRLIAQFPSMRYIPGAIEMNAMKAAHEALFTTKPSAASSASSGKFANKHKGMHVEKYIASITYIHVNRSICLTDGVAYAPKVSDPPDPVLPNFCWGSGVREGSWVSNFLNPISTEGIDQGPCVEAPHTDRLLAGRRRSTSLRVGFRPPCRPLDPRGPNPTD